MKLLATRRAVLAGTAAGALAGAPAGATWLGMSPAALILQRNLPAGTLARIALRHSLAGSIVLGEDVVRHWREGLHGQVRGTRSRAYVRWAEANMLAGLAREAGGSSRVRRFGPDIAEVELRLI